MEWQWLKKSQSVGKGVSIINQLEEEKFEQFLHHILSKLKVQNVELFTEEEKQKLMKIFKVDEESLLLAMKTICYMFKKMLKYIFMPANLKKDLRDFGLTSDKADFFVKVWSSETRAPLDELGTKIISDSNNDLNFSWKLNAELSSDYHKKCKVPKTYVSFLTNTNELELELSHPDVYSMFLQFESIQNELDNLM